MIPMAEVVADGGEVADEQQIPTRWPQRRSGPVVTTNKPAIIHRKRRDRDAELAHQARHPQVARTTCQTATPCS